MVIPNFMLDPQGRTEGWGRVLLTVLGGLAAVAVFLEKAADRHRDRIADAEKKAQLKPAPERSFA